MLSWANRFNISCFLDNNQYSFPLHSQECLLGAGSRHILPAGDTDHLEALNGFICNHQDWIFGHLSYDLKNSIHGLTGTYEGYIDFPEINFFVPEIVIKLDNSRIEIGSCSNDHELVFSAIMDEIDSIIPRPIIPDIRQRLTEKEYVAIIETIRQHIVRGDCYELNYCMEFYAKGAEISPLDVFASLSVVSPNPFSAYYRYNDQYLLCASPERYIRKLGNKIFSQPIKGTISRATGSDAVDQQRKDELYNSAKDRSENVMVVDLVRNDLAMVCEGGSVKVDELFGVYSFPQVHQMISTISGELKEGTTISDIFRYTFPMGSMTGAPKRRVMELIEKYEKTKRGLFSGAVGYISPERDMDFNVVIRSILYNAASQYLSFPVGSGITYYSNAAKEYEECLLKAEAMFRALQKI
jgi:para-aminobenzoate synthetase component 1